jgi:hypothetical protein
MSGNYYVGAFSPGDILGQGTPRYFYGLRRDEDGDLFFVRIDQMLPNEAVTINETGLLEDNYEDFQPGIDFYEGRDVNHNIVYKNLKYEQYRWDARNIYYYIDETDGTFVVRVNEGYNYNQ